MRPVFDLTKADLCGVPPELVERRRVFIDRYAGANNLPADPARWTREQLFAMLDDPAWPRSTD